MQTKTMGRQMEMKGEVEEDRERESKRQKNVEEP